MNAPTKPLDEMTVKELRQYAIANGLGITYAGQRKKHELLTIIKQEMGKRK